MAQNVTVSGALFGNGSYPTLTAAFAALNGGAQTSAAITVSVINDTWEGSGTALLNAGTWTSITVVPVGQPRTIAGATTAGQPMVDLNGADRVTFSGLIGGQKGLTFFNSSTSTLINTSTIRLRSDAQYNSFKHCKLLGASQTDLNTPGGNVLFAPGTVGGSSRDTIDNCELGPGDANLPSKCIYNYGSTTQAHMNELNTVSNSQFYDCFSATQASSAIMLREGGRNWRIKGNQFFQSGLRVKTSGSHHNDIRVESTMGNFSHGITENIFGTRPTPIPSKSQFQLAHTDAAYIPIMMGYVSLQASNIIAINQIKDISITMTPVSGVGRAFVGIQNAGSNALVHYNLIGSTTDSSSIVINGMHSQSTSVWAILGGQSDYQSFNGNVIGGIQVFNTAGRGAIFTGIGVDYLLGTVAIEANTIGYAAAPITVRGAGLQGRLKGIAAFAGDLAVKDNQVAHLYSNQSSPVMAPGLSAANIGIYAKNGSIGTGQVLRNTVHSIVLSHPNGTNGLTGIETDNNLLISSNQVHSLYLATTHSGSMLIGLDMLQGHADVTNNMIRLGFSPTGVPMTTGLGIVGIHNKIARPRYDHNSIYIGGTGVADTSDTYVLYSQGGHSAMRFLNNIFVNARSNASGTGTHYVLTHGGSPAFPPIPTSNGNDLLATGVGGKIGKIDGVDLTSIFDWRAYTGQDFNSISNDPRFINPAGSAATGDLHIGPSSPIEGLGVAGPFISVDIDNQVRASLTPRDIGADAGNFVAEAVLQPEVELRGNGTVMQTVDLTPSTLDGTDFGTLSGCGVLTASRSFTVRNLGNADLNYSGPILVGSSAFTASPPGGAVIAPGQSLTFTVQFSSALHGTYTASLLIATNDLDESNFFIDLIAVAQADNVAPVAVCQPMTLPIGSNGLAVVNAAALGSGSTDNCAIASYTATPAQFTCGQLGAQAVQLSVADAGANTSTCSTTVTVVDNTAPNALCQTSTLALNAAGQGSLTSSMVDNGSTDNCGIVSMVLSQTAFACGDLGTRPVTLTLTDAVGNVSVCSTQVNVVDNSSPVTSCSATTLFLNSAGQAQLTASALALTGTDNCGIVGSTLSQSAFDCSDLGTQVVTGTMTDAAGNAGNCTANVTVVDNLPPVALCQPATLYLNNAGQAQLPPVLIDGGSSDNCAIATRLPSQVLFSCADVGVRPVTLTVTDASGNTATCSTQVTVQDFVEPVLTCANLSVTLPSSGPATLTPAMVGTATDACGIASYQLSPTQVSCPNVGTSPVRLIAVDANGNADTCFVVLTTVTAPLAMALSPSPTGPCGHHLACAGQANASATASVTGACAPYTYAWSNGQASATATGLGAGVHSVTVTAANGQQQAQSVTLTAPVPLVATLTATPSCVGSSTGGVSATATGGLSCQAYTYLWNTGATASSLGGLAPGTYHLTLTDAAGCTDTASVVVGTWPAPSIAITQNLGTLVATPGFVAYQWHNAVGAIPGATGSQFTPLATGSYHVVATDSNGCTWTSASFPFTFVGAAQALPGWADIVLYPNPGQGVFQFAVGQPIPGPVLVMVSDLSGRVLYAETLAALEGVRVFDLSDVAAGVYVVGLHHPDAPWVYHKWIRQ